MNKAIFLDRDGTLLVEMGYLLHHSLVVPYCFTLEALRKAREQGYLLIVVTNQSAVARGYLSEAELALIHLRMQEIFRSGGAALDGIYYCPHYPTGAREVYRRKCGCRKPGTDLGLAAARRFDIDLKQSFMIGDTETDLLFGRNLGTTACLVRTGSGAFAERGLDRGGLNRVKVFDHLLDAVTWIAKEGRRCQ